VSAPTVRIRAVARADTLPNALPTSAAGTISSMEPGGWTIAKSRYGITPLTRRSALPMYTPSSYCVNPVR
jgi:hypothetical protein